MDCLDAQSIEFEQGKGGQIYFSYSKCLLLADSVEKVGLRGSCFSGAQKLYIFGVAA
jgi:hypothetical protein